MAAWRLVVLAPPDEARSLLLSHGFTRTAIGENYCRVFSSTDRARAEAVRAALLEAGLTGTWRQVTPPKTPAQLKFLRPATRGERSRARATIRRAQGQLV